jgi:hypothetical protein
MNDEAAKELRLLPNKDAGYHENNLARAAIWWLAPDLQQPIWEALELTGFAAKVSGIPPELGPLTLYDSLVFVVAETLWARQGPDARAENFVPYSIRELWAGLGHAHAPSHLDAERIRRSLLRLSYAKVEREWYDTGLGATVHALRGIIADADFIKSGRPGEFGRLQRGWLRFSPELHRQLMAKQTAYALDLPTLLELSTPLAQRLYLLLAADQMKPAGEKLVAYTYPLGRAFYETLGITDTNPDRIRRKIKQAALELMEREPLYVRIEVVRKAGRSGARYQLEVVRRTGRSLAPVRRREAALAAARLTARAALPVSAAQERISEPTGATRAIDEADYARRTAAAKDPRVRAAFERWVREAVRGPNHEMALREYRRDLIEWIAGGETDAMPVEVELSDEG